MIYFKQHENYRVPTSFKLATQLHKIELRVE